MKKGLDIAFFGSSLVSAFWNGAATYYRGIIRALNDRGHRVTFYEPDVYDRQKNRDIEDPRWARVVVYSGKGEDGVSQALETAKNVDVLIKTSGCGAFDELLEAAVIDIAAQHTLKIFWDVDAPATLDRVHQNAADPFLNLIPQYDLILTYGGGEPVINAYKELGAKECMPIYNALDSKTHYRVQPESRFEADLGLLANRLPDREERIEEFFLNVAERLPEKRFLLGGNGWNDKPMPANLNYLGHIYTKEHNPFNSTPRAILNVNRDSMARYGFSPPTRVFEAAGAGACLITDEWEGIESFLEPDKEILVAKDGAEVAAQLDNLTQKKAHEIGSAALRRVLAEHTYAHRVEQLEILLNAKTKTAAL